MTCYEWDEEEIRIRKLFLGSPRVEFVEPSGLRTSFQKTGLIAYPETENHITISKDFGLDKISQPCPFREELIFDSYCWEVEIPASRD